MEKAGGINMQDHCSSWYRKLNKMLDEKKDINFMANELCNQTKNPRRNLILDLKEYKGDEWLVTNADWLGYGTKKAKQAEYTLIASCCSTKASVATSAVSEVPGSIEDFKKFSGASSDEAKNYLSRDKETVCDVFSEEVKERKLVRPLSDAEEVKLAKLDKELPIRSDEKIVPIIDTNKEIPEIIKLRNENYEYKRNIEFLNNEIEVLKSEELRLKKRIEGLEKMIKALTEEDTKRYDIEVTTISIPYMEDDRYFIDAKIQISQKLGIDLDKELEDKKIDNDLENLNGRKIIIKGYIIFLE